MDVCQKRRGIYKNLTAIDENRNLLVYEIPLATIVSDFFDKLKSMSS